MTRASLASANRTEINSPDLRRAWCVKLAWTGGTMYLTTAAKALTVDGQSYLPTGGLLDVTGISEGAADAVNPITILLSGLDDDIITAAAGFNHFDQATVYEAFLSEAHVLVADAHEHGVYEMSHIEDNGAGDEPLITLTCENLLWALGERVDPCLVDGPSQRSRAADTSADTFFDHVVTITGIEVLWGKKVSRISNGGPGAGGSAMGSYVSVPQGAAIFYGDSEIPR